MNVLIVVHLFYPEIWPELRECIRVIGAGADLVVTYQDAAAVVDAHRDFPSARFVQVENRGFDVWPFLKIVQEVDLAAYDLVVKLHSKRNFDVERAFNGLELKGAEWRRRLLSFCATPGAWSMSLAKLSDPHVGMIAGHGVVVSRGGVPSARMRRTFDRARREIEVNSGLRVHGGAFVAGTMFAVRPVAMAPMLKKRFKVEDFPAGHLHNVETPAHRCERMFGLSVGAAGLRIESFDQSVRAMRLENRLRMIRQAVLRFLYQHKQTSKGYDLVKVCKIPVWRRRIGA